MATNSLWLRGLLLAALCIHATSETMGPAAQLEPPVRVASRTPEPGDKYGNGSNRGTLWFPHAISTLPSGVLLLRVAVHPDALMPYNHAALFTSVDRGRSWLPQNPGCSNANVSACSLQFSATDRDQQLFSPTLSWEMAIPQAAGSCDQKLPATAVAGLPSDRMLMVPYQPHLLGDGTSVEFDATQLMISPQGRVTVLTAQVPVIVSGLPHPVKDSNYTACVDCGQPFDPPGLRRRLASAHASNASPIPLV